jgi:hexosaminidase
MRSIILSFFSLLLFTASSQNTAIIPKPVSVQARPGTFNLFSEVPLIVGNEADKKTADFLNSYLQQYYGFSLKITAHAKNGVRLVTRQFVKAPEHDSYSLIVSSAGINIEGDTEAGTFYGVQSLIQLMPIAPPQTQNPYALSIPAIEIKDRPRFAYRGMHLDVSRHFFPLTFVKKYIDYIALHKMNFFHWHLTDDQGWRIEIKKYPKLTEVGAWRDGTLIGRYPGTGNDSIRYGGFYTQAEIKEVVQYARDRHITVVPEIEMPGHALAALSSYPYLGCVGNGPYKVAQTWGVFEDVFCAGNDSTFLFLQDVMDEVTALFPAQYVHVGGDESPKEAWRKCPRCQARIKQQGLKDEHELQSYFIRRMEKYLNAKGKTIIGWDEILEGGLAPNAIVMSWRGESGGIAAAKEGHKVIMTPGSHCYFDHTQAEREDSVTFGGYTPLEKVYSYEPVPKELTPLQAKVIMGAQANLWTEYIRYPSKVEYMIFPRMSAMSEVLWSPAASRNYKDFERRMQQQYKRYAQWGAHYSNAVFALKTKILPAPQNNGLLLQLETKDPDGKITYDISEKHFLKNYTSPVHVQESSTITVMNTRGGKLLDSTTIVLKFNKATGKKIILSEPPAANYPGDGAFTLVDGVINEKGMSRSKEFIGFNGKNISATVDMGAVQEIKEMRLHALFSSGSWIYPPQLVTVLVSSDGRSFERIGSAREFAGKNALKGHLAVVPERTVAARYVRIQVEPVQKISANMPGAGEKAWMFLDELEVF